VCIHSSTASVFNASSRIAYERNVTELGRTCTNLKRRFELLLNTFHAQDDVCVCASLFPYIIDLHILPE
jgi:hypothetical protein